MRICAFVLALALDIVFGQEDDRVLQASLKKSLQPDPSLRRPVVLFIAPGLGLDMASLAANDTLACGSINTVVVDGSQHLIRSTGYPAEAPLGNCTWNFIVSPGVNVDLMCEVFDVDCASGNRLLVSLGGDTDGLCHNSSLLNQRVSLKTRSVATRLILTHSVKEIPGGRISCLVRGIGGGVGVGVGSNATSVPSGGKVTKQQQQVTGCGLTKYSKIVGGEAAQPNEFPWMTYLALGSSACGGTVVNNNWIMTAGHCAQNMNPSSIRAYTGCHQLSLSSCDAPRTISRNLVNPGYNSRTLVNDVALLRLSSPVSFSARVAPVCLPTADVPAGYRMTAAGWGLTSPGGTSLSGVLKKATEQSITDEQCRRNFNIPSSVLCTLAVSGSTCNGDSGGFLGSQRGGKYEQDGIVSFGGSRCAAQGVPDGFTEVRAFITWIKSVIAT